MIRKSSNCALTKWRTRLECEVRYMSKSCKMRGHCRNQHSQHTLLKKRPIASWLRSGCLFVGFKSLAKESSSLRENGTQSLGRGHQLPIRSKCEFNGRTRRFRTAVYFHNGSYLHLLCRSFVGITRCAGPCLLTLQIPSSKETGVSLLNV